MVERGRTQKNIVVITGGSGFGKTSLVNALAKQGYRIGHEIARELIVQQLASNGDLLPWKNAKAFQSEVLTQRIRFWEETPEGTLAFSDRGIPDQLAFARWRGFEPSPVLLAATEKYRYAKKVFVCPPWPEIFTTDEVRTEDYESACRLHLEIVDCYTHLGYELIELPKVDVDARVRFILDLQGEQA